MGGSRSKLEESPILSDLATHAKHPMVTITPEMIEFFKEVETKANRDKLVRDFMSKMNDDVIKSESDVINILIKALELATTDEIKKLMIIKLSELIGVKKSKISNYAASDNTDIQRSFFKVFSDKLYTFYNSMKSISTFSKTLWDIGKHPITTATFASINYATTGEIGTYPMMTILCNIPEIKIGPIDVIPRLGCLVFVGLAFIPLIKTPADYFFWGANKMGISSVSSSYEASIWATKFVGYTLVRQAFNDKQIEAITPLVKDILAKIGNTSISAYNASVHVIKLANETLDKGSTIVNAVVEAVDYANNNMDIVSEKVTVLAGTLDTYVNSNYIAKQTAIAVAGKQAVENLKQISEVGFLEAMKQKGPKQLAIAQTDSPTEIAWEGGSFLPAPTT